MTRRIVSDLRTRPIPPRRLLAVTQGLVEAGVGGVVASICQSVDPDNADYTADFGPAVASIAARIAASLPTSCLPRPLIRRGDDKRDLRDPRGASRWVPRARSRKREAVTPWPCAWKQTAARCAA
jgi:hypothetical protein